MSKIRIYTLARELKLPNFQVIELARSLGADVATPSSAIDDVIAARIREQKAANQSRVSASAPAKQTEDQPRQAAETASASPEPAPATEKREPAPKTSGRHPRSRGPQGVKAPAPAIQTESTPAATPSARSHKRHYLVDGLNVCNWQKTPSLTPLLTLLIELKRQGHSFLCIFDANTRFVLDDLGERDRYEHLLNKYDCFGEVPGGTQADDFLLFRAHKTGDAIISNDQYRDPKYRERYKWLRSVSPRLCKGIVLGGFLNLPELDVHARVRESLPATIKEFEDVFGSGIHRERPTDHRQAHGAHRRSEARVDASAKPEEKAARSSVKTETPPAPVEQASKDTSPVQNGEQAVEQPAEQRPRSRRRRRGRGRRGGGGGGARVEGGGAGPEQGNGGGDTPQG